jgi:DNA-binding NarL/FixJ family response regulator
MIMRSVLVADGLPLSRRGLHGALEVNFPGLDIFDADCLDVAVNLLAEKHTIDLAIFAIPMPGVQSVEALHDVLEHYPDTRFVVLSSSISRTQIVAALSVGLHGYLVNSQTESEMIGAITDILAGHIYVPPIMSEIVQKREWENPQNQGLLNRHHAIEQEIADLTPRQFEVMSLLAAGVSNKEIARDLHIAEATVKIHVAAVIRTLGARNRTEAAVLIASNHRR